MKRINILSLSLFAVGFALLGASPVSAATVYDDLVKTTDNITLDNIYGGPNVPLDNPSYRSIPAYSGPTQLNDTDFQYYTSGGQTTFDNVDSIVQTKSLVYKTISSNSTVTFFITDDPDASLTFDYVYDYYNALIFNVSNGHKLGIITYRIDQEYRMNVSYEYVDVTSSDYFRIIAADPTDGNDNRIFFTDANITYPPGYNGEDIPGELPIIPKDLDYWLDFTYTNTTDQIIANYVGKKTSPVSSLSDPKWVWWTLYKDAPNTTDGENVCEITELATKPFNLIDSCPDLDIDNSATYYLRAGVNPIDNPHIQRPDYNITYLFSVFVIDFSKPSQGTTLDCVPGATGPSFGVVCAEPKVIDFTQCFTDSFPFVDPFACADNFVLIFSLLTTGSTITGVPRWGFDPTCKSLNTFDEWLNLPSGYVVCPQFPSAIRNIVTPFIAFLLGIVTLGFISRHNSAVRGGS